MILNFATYIILTRNLTHYPKYQIYTLTGPLQYFLRILYQQCSVPTKPIFFSKSAICWSKGKYFWQYSKHSFRKFDKLVEIYLVYINTGLVRNLGHINVFLGLWAQLFKENLGTYRLAIKLEGTQQQCMNSSTNFSQNIRTR